MTDTDNGEASIEEKYAYFLELARSLPTIDVNDPRVQAILNATTKEERGEAERPFGPWGHDFVLIFRALRVRRIDPDSKLVFVSGTLKPMEKLGEPWQRFLANNGGLLAEIDATLAEKESLDGLMIYHRDLLFDPTIPVEKGMEMSRGLLSAPDHPLGLDAIQYYFADRLNPHLRTAWAAMESEGIDPIRFTR